MGLAVRQCVAPAALVNSKPMLAPDVLLLIIHPVNLQVKIWPNLRK